VSALPADRTDKRGDPFQLREYRPGDRTELGRMYDDFEPKRVAQGLPPMDAVPRSRWLDTVLSSGHHVMVEVDGRIAGHGMLLPFVTDGAELANFLHQSVRDRGIGTALNQTLLELAREQSISRVWLSVEPSNRRAVRSYEKVGFKRRFTSGWAPELEMEVILSPDDGP
jgi:L-amino acid N-acyltransferase YncA